MKILRRLVIAAWIVGGSLSLAGAEPSASEPPVPLASLDVAAYMGTWYQVAWYPNRVQKQCVADTQASYRLTPDGRVEVSNRCRLADGSIESISGIARPVGQIEDGQLKPAQLEVSFLPSWLRWLPFGWGSYWVVYLDPEGRYAIVSEARRQYLWVLSRTAAWTGQDDAAVRAELQRQGFDLGRLETHPQTAAAADR